MAEPQVWAQGQRLSAQQIKSMLRYPELLALSLRTVIEQAEEKAHELGVEEPQIMVLFLTEFVHAPDEEES